MDKFFERKIKNKKQGGKMELKEQVKLSLSFASVLLTLVIALISWFLVNYRPKPVASTPKSKVSANAKKNVTAKQVAVAAKNKIPVVAKKIVAKQIRESDQTKFLRWAKTATSKDIERVKLQHLPSIRTAAAKNSVDANIILSTIYVESNGRNIVGKAGERGPMQIKYATGKIYGADIKCLDNPRCNIMTGAKYIRTLQARYGNLEKVVLAYNRGKAPAIINRNDPYLKKFKLVFASAKQIKPAY